MTIAAAGEVLYVATFILNGQPMVLGELAVKPSRDGDKWRAVMFIGGKEYASKSARTRADAVARCDELRKFADKKFASHPMLSSCRFHRASPERQGPCNSSKR